jgi:hypothetical protein
MQRLVEDTALAFGEDDNNEVSGEPRKKKARTERSNNGLTRKSDPECKCGSKEHKRITSSNCPWKGLMKKIVAEKYALRLAEINLTGEMNVTGGDPTAVATANATDKSEEHVQCTSKYWVVREPIAGATSTHI